MNIRRAALVLALASSVACDDHQFNTGEGTKVEGEGIDAVKQIMEGNCVSCHGDSSPSANLSLTSDAFCDAVLDGRLVIPNDSGGSVLQQRIEGDPSPMPPAGLMDDSNIQIVADWIDAGADCDSTGDGGGSGDDGGSGDGGDDSGSGDDGGGSPDGEAIYAASCAGCHGASGEGGFGPAMTTAVYGMDAAEVADVALNGSEGGGMSGQLTDSDEADAVGEYSITTWGG